jgi:MoxR-like ATPase
MVIATQNPLEYHGTFPLPESQLDRFMMQLRIGYPSYENEKIALIEMKDFEDIESIKPAVTREEIISAQSRVDEIFVDESLIEYILNIVTSIRNHDKVRLGISTRGAQFLLKAAKGSAYLEGRTFVLPEDIKEVAPHVFGHRVILKARTFIRDAVELIRDILDKTPVPV